MAKLIAAAFNEPGRIWEEHEQFRSAVLTPPDQPALTPDLMARAAAIWKRAREAEARHGAH